MVMVLALSVFLGLTIFGVLTQSAIATLQDKIDISVYFKSGVSEDDISNVERSTQSLAEVKNVEYISRDKALEIFKEKHKNDATIGKALEELGDNPLAASLNVKAKDPKDYGVIASYLQNDKFSSLIDKVTYGQNQLAINRLVKIADTASAAGLAITIILALVAVVVTFNTVRLAIYSSREEIGIMRLVGASNAYIRGPYVVEGIIYGLVSAVFALLLVAPVVHLASPYISVVIPEMNLIGYFYGHLLGLASYSLLFGVLLGVVSGSIAVTRYLRV